MSIRKPAGTTIDKELKQYTIDRLLEIFPKVDPFTWNIDIMLPDNIVQVESYNCTSVYFNFLPDGRYEVEIFLPIDGQILSYKFDSASIAKMFYMSHVEHLQAIRQVISSTI